MDSKTRVKKTSVTGGTGCKQPGKKNAKERESSRLNVFIYSAGGKSSNCHELVHNYDELGTTNISSMVVRDKVTDLLAKEGSALPSAAFGEFFDSKYLLSTGLKQILRGKSLPHTNGMLEIVLVCLYSPKVQDPHRLHWPDFVVAISKA
ncbi:hypothetical protein AVEN_175597-1 [Araneus ventricosus]|uniref:Uncharacterized protein n=1 Tax=Araneus ventricosus TaxID=182803 RepID=A0A4Y2G440_ARAVE|nr:hypothetical protein AVEN_175597-1 [Araneus ventricosus]